MTPEKDYGSETEEQSRISRCGRTEKPASETPLMSLEEERQLCAILSPLMF